MGEFCGRSGGRGGLKVLELILEGLAQVPKSFNLGGHSLALFTHICLHLEMSLLNELDIFDFGLEGADLELLGLDLRLISFEALRVVTHLILDLIEFLHVVVDLF